MEGDDRENGPDPDDWFSEPDVLEPAHDHPATATSTESADIDDWLDESRTAAPRRRRRPSTPANPVVIVAVGLGLVVLLIIGLAVGGVFSSGSSTTTPPLYTITTHTTATTTTTTTTPSSTVAAPTTTLKPGDTGHQVTVLQLSLAHLGFSPGKADGVYGPATEEAVKKFQTAHGLTADGICGPKTIEALKQALS
ncbi:MAG TPA: peptidoglycan-binding domain-containing protein [Gaiellaceae bacterium]|nr:peptidoglycan-binding domain-containing protein [Gaiellaceae bacterium]